MTKEQMINLVNRVGKGLIEAGTETTIIMAKNRNATLADIRYHAGNLDGAGAFMLALGEAIVQEWEDV